MSLETLPEKVRHSELVLVLEEKLGSPQPVAFDYWSEFKRLRETVSAQTGEMKVLFPKFTPHDEAHHVSRLFGIADKLLGLERYRQMNPAELFLLACGLYAHDWGMAVSSEEINYLRSGGMGKVNADVFTPLDDETQRLRHFTESQGIRAPDAETFPTISDEQLRLYVRRTHAWRSGVRARAFFKAVGSSVPQALEKVCQGHWLDFAELDDERRFSSQAGVLGYTVNLRAVALYVRLVDLFDISDDRTPYAVWRFVAPLDGVSQMEWNKHRALSPVTFPEHGDGRSVRFDGSTSDAEVWAELEDLRHYCEEQISGTMDLMARHRDERHQLDLRKLEWAVSAERFKPVNIRFEFQRRRMFDILADEIYQGDSYVFLRELLQNSIDAIRMRRELIQRRTTSGGRHRDVGLGFDDAIYFDVEHREDGDAVVRCRDYGIGMDEYIVRNYLAVAGVSYYQSDEFRHLGLKMDPIARFGIGIMSCFMVADTVEIVTRREPQMTAQVEPLRIEIPAVERQFRIYPAGADVDIGTTVTVYVLGKKLKEDVRKNKPPDERTQRLQLHVTQYLREVAGFVEFPVIIDESGERTVVLSPDRPPTDADAFRVDDTPYNVTQSSKQYEWDKVFAAQDVHIARQHLREQSFDLKEDLGLGDYEGKLSYIRPLSDEAEIGQGYGGVSDYEPLVISAKETAVTVRARRTYGYLWMSKEGLAPSSQTNHAFSVYRDGLLVADATPPRRNDRFQRIGISWPVPTLHVNLPKKLTGDLDVARRALLGTDASWDAPIWRQMVTYLGKHEFAVALNHEPETRIYRLATLAYIFRLTGTEIVELVSDARWPLPVLIPNHGVVLQDKQLALGQIVRATPNYLDDEIKRALGWVPSYERRGDNRILSKWTGDVSVALLRHVSDHGVAELWNELSKWHLTTVLAPVGVRFLVPPYPGLRPLSQNEFQCIAPAEIREVDLMEQTMLDPLSLDASAWCCLRRTWWHYEMKSIVEAAPFNPPFERLFIGTDDVLNLRHPTTVALLRCMAAVRWHQLNKTRPPADIGKAEDQLKSITEHLGYGNLQYRLDRLWLLAKECKFLDLNEPPAPLSAHDYIQISASSHLMEQALTFRGNEGREKVTELAAGYLRPFGCPLEDVEPEDPPIEIIRMMTKSDS